MTRQGRGRSGARRWRLAQLVGITGLAVSYAATGAAASDWQKRLQQLEQGAAAYKQIAQAGVAPYDIPAQPLSSALTAFGQQSGLQVAVDSAILEGLQSQPVSGTLTPEEALGRLLSGTDVTWRMSEPNIVMLERVVPLEPRAMTLQPLTVTAERTERSIMDTATSVVVLDADTIEQRPGMKSTNDIMSSIPNVVAPSTSNIAPAVRGVDGTGPAQGADAFLAGTRPRLNVQIDGRPQSYNEVVFGDVSLWDVEQVEVLRGAQSTLQGRNAIAGTVAVKTNDPTYDFEVGARAIGGDYDRQTLSGMVSGPLIEDQLAFRVAIDQQLSESYVDFEDDVENVGDPGDSEFLNARAKLLIEPKAWEGFSSTITLTHSDYLAPQTESVLRPADEHESSYPLMPTFNPVSTGGIVDTKWQINDNWALENTTSVTSIEITRKAVPGDGNAEIEATEIVSEPRVRFTGLDGRLNALGGIYVFNNEQDEFIDLFGGGTFHDETTTLAVFGEGTLTVFEDFDITLGARYEREERRRTGALFVFENDLDETYDAFLPKIGLAWHPTDQLTFGAVVSRGYNGGGAGFTYDVPFESYTFKPEYVWTYETYARAELLNKTLTLTGNLFYSRYKDMQVPLDLNPDPSVWSYVIRNADRVDTYGAELGARWLAAPGLTLFGEVGLLETDIKEYRNSPFEGNDLALAPNVTADFGILYRHESGFEVSADARYSGDYFSTVENLKEAEVDSYWLLNAQVGYTFGADANVRIFGFVNNILDSDDPTLIDPGSVATTSDDVLNVVHPRSFGVGVEAHF
ncbi:TonB-dependent receptor domain-containing protein [Dongia deserti]|uniref:TonB-dependent receptor domain-containing protein n=1 Tax=Dongia deserti TaxID=2268030 RepID=UPI0013C430A8|nr:TonB-dependent receptor [Dongia deserti]